ncbi:toxin glutamine deamidase domain-containing protein [Micromonospora yasonensis]|uniref:toxin glutamine deamidase domain-containing protein n=1 Tax=Micromonospora yasonensis TaxID=1128667 RepID=UPI00222E7CC7|nr:toxin glutamine deamidase domain-containing protein [Micromonospora yasonensis]MCW3839780.1 toxin glutamine deamidase domain-containing protein [Micromonospora yasonensis]
MTLLPSPIPHPLDYCPWDVPGWIYEALDWVVGVEWPDGNERAVWDLADQWYGIADVLGIPRNDAITAAGEVRSGYGGVGLVAKTFDIAWHKVAEGEDAPLHAVLTFTGELGKVVESCGCDLEGAKLEAWIELGILVIELLSLAVVTVVTAGVASPAVGAATTASRVAMQQIFKRLVAQLARKAVKEGLKEAGERAAKEVVKSGARTLARRAVIGGLVEAGQEAGTNLATQAYQNSTGRRDGLDLADAGMSGLGGFAGGAVAPLAGLGGHAHGRFTQIGEHLGREMAGETLAEGVAGLATGQGVSLEDLARAAVSGVSGSATGQADAAMHQRLDGKLAGLAQPMDLALPSPTDVSDAAGTVPAQRTSDLLGSVTAPQVDAVRHPAASDSLSPVDGAAGKVSSPAAGPDSSVANLDPHSVQPAVDLETHGLSVGSTTSPTLSSVAVESPVSATHPVASDPKPGPAHAALTADLGTANQPAPVQANATPTVVSGSAPIAPPSNGSTPTPADRLSAGPVTPQPGPATHPYARPVLDPAAGQPVTGPDVRPTPNPRFPQLEALAPATPYPARDPSPAVPGPFEAPPPRMTPEERAARLAADREALDRRHYQLYLQSQREWYEENRREEEAEWCRVRADRLRRAAGGYGERALQLQLAGHELLARQWQKAAFDASTGSYELRERAQQILAGSVVPDEVRIEASSDFDRINDDVADLARGAVETSDRSALTGDGHPPPIDRTRRYGVPGGLRPPLALHQTDLERQMPRNPDGSVVRTADPRYGGWFQLANDGGPQADATRGINCLDCTLSLYETWMHGRPRVSAPRTFDGYLQGDVRMPVDGELDGPKRVEEVTGGYFQDLCLGPDPTTPLEARQRIERGYRDLHWQLLGGGHGSYAFLITSYEGGGSHAWVALNQNGTVLYLDPQNGSVWDRPLYTHSGVPHPHNMVAIDALVLGPDGQPMPLAGRPPGVYNVLPELREPPEPPRPPAPPTTYDGDGDLPDFNHAYLLGEDTTFHRSTDPSPPGSLPAPDPEDVRRNAHRDAHAERIAAGLFVRDAVAASGSLADVFAAGVTPVELAQHVDPPTLRRLVPGLDEAAAGDVARLLDDPRVQQMLDQTWEAPPRREPLLAETLVHQLTQRADLVRMILATPELANSLTARPLTLHHLASHQKAIEVLGDVLDDITERGAAVVAAAPTPPVLPTPLTAEQLAISSHFDIPRPSAFQPGFDQGRQSDVTYQRHYLDELYEAAAEAQLEIDALGRRLAMVSRGGEYHPRPGPKDRTRAEDKVAEYNGNCSRLKDLAAGRVSYHQLDDLYAALEVLIADPSVKIAKFEDRFIAPQKSGYRDVQIMLRTSSGHIAEFRLQLAALDEVAEWEHSLFEVGRDLEAVVREQGRSVSQMEAAIRKGIIQRQREYFWAALQLTLNKGQER